VLFMTPLRRLRAEWFNHVMLPLNLVSNFVDVVSYVRLFAVGMATFAMASAFNEMAGGMARGAVGHLAAAALLFLGHTLNILLASMGVLVHGIRLNTLEFSGHLGLEWSGRPYRPLTRDPKLKT
jgi:V/A-type H+-transporting ATPase subunit I